MWKFNGFPKTYKVLFLYMKPTLRKRFDNGESVASIVASSGIPRSTIYAWIKSSKENGSKQEISLRNYRTLEAKVKRLEGIIEILQKADCRISDPLKERLNALEKLYGQYSAN